MPHDVFISYAAGDKVVADAACATLESRRLRCWIAPRDVLPGMNYGEAIVKALRESRVVVLLFSSRANESQQVMREVERAVHLGIPILPFRIEDTVPSPALEYFISTPHWLDALTPPLERHLLRLCTTVDALLQVHADAHRGASPAIQRSEASSPPAATEPEAGEGSAARTPSTRRALRGSLLAAGLLAIGATGWLLSGLFSGDPPAEPDRGTTLEATRGVPDPPPTRLEEVGLVPAVQLLGRALDPEGRPVPGVGISVAAAAAPGSPVATAMSDGEGRFAVSVAPGSYSLGCTSEWWMAVPLEFLATVEVREAALPDLVLTPLGSITGRVMDGVSGVPLADAIVTATPSGVVVGSGWNTRTDAAGTFALKLPATRYHLTVGADSFEGEILEVDLRAEARTSRDFRLRPLARIDGVVLDASGRPLSGVQILARRDPPTGAVTGIAETAFDGFFSMAVPGGIYDLEAGMSGSRNGPVRAEVKAGELLEGIEIRFPELFHRRGRVLNQNGEGLGGVTVHAWATPGSYQARTRTAADGTYNFDTLEWFGVLSVTDGRWVYMVWWDPPFTGGDTERDIVIPFGSLEVSVRDESGAPVSDAAVILDGVGIGLLREKSDQRGVASFASIPEGDWRMRAEMADHRSDWASVSVSSGIHSAYSLLINTMSEESDPGSVLSPPTEFDGVAAWMAYAESCQSVGLLAAAEDALRHVTDTLPGAAMWESHFRLAAVLRSQVRWDEAVVAFYSLLALQRLLPPRPEHALTYYHLTQLLLLQGRSDEARVFLREGVSAFPDDPNLQFLLLGLAEVSEPDSESLGYR